jgi:DNA-binding beta-propeller fold protein YncE
MKKAVLSLYIILAISLTLFSSFKAQAVVGDYLFKWGSEFYAQFPVYTAIDGSGNVYVSDHANHHIHVYSPDGSILKEWGSFGTSDGQFRQPYGIALDGSGNVYVVDSLNNRIQVFAPDGTFIRKWGGSWYYWSKEGDGHGLFNYPYGIAIDGNDKVYVSDYGNHRIQVFDSDGTFINTWGSEGTSDGQFNFPYSIAINKANGEIYVADGGNHRIQVFSSNGTFLRKWGSFGHPGPLDDGFGKFYNPYGVAVDGSGNVFVADTYNHRIQKFTSNGEFIMTWGSFGNNNGQFKNVYGVTVDGSGKLYASDRTNSRIQIFSLDGTFLSKWENHGAADGQFNYPFDITLNKKNGKFYVADCSNHRIQVFDSEGKFVKAWGSYGTAHGQFRFPRGITADENGRVFVADRSNNRIQVFDSEGNFLRVWGNPGTGDGQFNTPEGIAVDGSGNIYVADSLNYRIQVFDPEGNFIRTWGSLGSAYGQFRNPRDVAIDDISGYIYVSDAFNYRIQVFDSNGTFINAWGSQGNADGEFNFPSRIALDKCGNVYVSDYLNGRIQVFSSNGTFLSKWGSSGSTNGKLWYPAGITVDENYRVYVSEVLNYRIQVFEGIVDKIPPMALCQDISLKLNALDIANINPADIDNGSCDTCGISNLKVFPDVFTCANAGANRVTLTATDASCNMSSCNATLTVTVEDNIPPLLDDISAPSDPVAINTEVDVNVQFTETCPDPARTICDWGDETISLGKIDGNGLITGSHTYNSPGVYELKITLTDFGNNSVESIFQYVVVYDPDGGFVTGGGWINSPAGAYTADPSLTGKANFGFVSKYKKGANTPTGETEFHFRIANLDFHSNAYQWLVVAGPNAKYKGTGTINGESVYGFMLTAVDGDIPGGGETDKFRIKIWDATDTTEEVIIYDNKIGTDDDSYEATELGGGSIVVHK